MLKINDIEHFEQIVDTAVKETIRSAPNTDLSDRWVNAILKAANLIRSCDGELTFWTFDFEANKLLVWSESNKIYSSNGTCDCRGYTVHHIPCWHRAASRLIARYFDIETGEMKADFLGCECGWSGLPRETIAVGVKPACPKCERPGPVATVPPQFRASTNFLGGQK